MKKILLLMTFVPFVIFAQNITLENLIEENLENVVNYKNINDEFKNNNSIHRSTMYNFLPSVGFSANRTKYLFDGMESKSSSFSISKSIPLNNTDVFNYLRSKNNIKNATLSFDEGKKNIVYNISRLYFEVIKSNKELEILEENYQIQKNVRLQTKIQFENNQKSLLDNQQSEIDLLNAEINLEEAKNSYRNARQNLFVYLQKEDNNEVFGYEETSLIELDKSQFSELSYDVKRQKNSLNSSDLSLLQEKIDFFPTLNLSWSYSASSYGDAIENSDGIIVGHDQPDFADMLNPGQYNDGASYTISLTYDFLNLLNHGESYSREKRNHKQSLRQFNYSKEEFEKDTQQLFQRYDVGYNSLQLTKRKLSLAEKNLEIADIKYKMGSMSLIDYDRARVDLLNTKMSYTRLYFDQILLQEEINLKFGKAILGRW